MRMFRLLTFVLVTLLTVACSKDKRKSEAPDFVSGKSKDIKANEEKVIKHETEDLFRSMKSETMTFIYKFGVAIDIPKTKKNYSTEQYKVALNMGVALADAISAVINKSEKNFLKYAEYINAYAERLNVSESILNKYTLLKNSVSEGKWDKVETFIYDIEETVFEELKNNDMTQESILVMVAGWIEGLYISSRSLQANLKPEATKALNKQNFVSYLQKNLDNLNDDLTNKNELVKIFRALPKIEIIINQKDHVFTAEEVANLVLITKMIHVVIVN